MVGGADQEVVARFLGWNLSCRSGPAGSPRGGRYGRFGRHGSARFAAVMWAPPPSGTIHQYPSSNPARGAVGGRPQGSADRPSPSGVADRSSPAGVGVGFGTLPHRGRRPNRVARREGQGSEGGLASATVSTPTLSASQEAALERFAALVSASPHNLVSKRARSELASRHVPECVALAGLLPTGSSRLLDVGSGGGFPGLVIAIVRPDLEVHLLDSTAKKTEFLARAAETLGLPNVSVHTGRAEELARGELGGTFDVVTARAVAALDRLLGWTVPFLRPDGVLYAVKGERWREELDAASDALRRTGARVLATPDDLPQLDDVRTEARPRVVMIGRLR
jgi:16S rRNA (guanine527-N7)-methyltransferase